MAEINTPANHAKCRNNNETGNNDKTLVVVGMARDCEQYLPSIKKTIQRVSDGFRLIRVVVFENDSTDETLNILYSWKQDLPADIIISERNLTGLPRTERLAYGRNTILQHVLDIEEHVDYMLVLDMDEVNQHLQHMQECFALPVDWGVCCANSYTFYYDLWALRTWDDWTNCDIVHSCGTRVRRAMNERWRHVSALQPPIPVDSCFGGAALYDFRQIRPILLSSNYNNSRPYHGLYPNENELCEHVPFHLMLRQYNISLYIQPKFLNDGRPILKNFPNYERIYESINSSWNHPEVRRYYEFDGKPLDIVDFLE